MTAVRPDGQESGSDDVTLVDDDQWPVAELYRVTPDDETVAVAEDDDGEAGTAVVAREPAAAGPRRQLPPFMRDERAARLVVALILALALAALTGWFLTRDDAAIGTTTPTEQTTAGPSTDEDTTTSTTPAISASVPNLTGVTLEEAREVLAEAGLRVRVRRTASDKPPGEVLSQLPAAGSEIAENGIVTLTVARGPERITVPGVVGEEASTARRELEDAGLRVQIERIASSKPNGTVIRQSPEAGAEVEDGRLVSLQVAKPRPAPKTVDVPRLTGLNVSDARSRLRALGLRSSVTRVESERPEGVVIDQQPSPGSALERGGSVSLTVSSGPAAVAVPDVVGLDETSARSELEAAGFDVRTIDEPTADPAEDGTVVGQSPAGGAERRPGAVVTIRVARLS